MSKFFIIFIILVVILFFANRMIKSTNFLNSSPLHDYTTFDFDVGIFNKSVSESDSDSESDIYLLSVADYTKWITDSQSDIANAFVGYELGSNKIVPWQQELAQCYVDVYNTNYNTSFTRSTLPPLTTKFIQSLPTTPVTLGPDDPINIVLPLFTNFTPDVPPSLNFYSYKPVNTSQLFYIKNSSRVQKLKDCVDLALSLNTPFYVNVNVINKLNNTDKNLYSSTIAEMPLDYFIRPVNYTYFDPLDLYLHPMRYTLNKGVGIMDTTQPNYTVFVEKNQLASLNRLLNISSIDTPMIHAFFELPDYTVEWNDSWRTQLFTQYDLYISKNMTTTQAFQQAIIDTLSTNTSTKLSSLDKDPSSYFNILPSNLYWVITLLSLFNSTASDVQNKLLLQRLVNAGYNPQDCYDYCDKEQTVCNDESEASSLACELTCGHESSEACEDNCKTLFENLINACQINNTTCKTQCLSNDNLPSNCSESSSICACGRMTAASYEPTICCPSNKTDFFMAYNYCYDMEDGSACWTDAMCKSGYCNGSDVIFGMKGKCSSKM